MENVSVSKASNRYEATSVTHPANDAGVPNVTLRPCQRLIAHPGLLTGTLVAFGLAFSSAGHAQQQPETGAPQAVSGENTSSATVVLSPIDVNATPATALPAPYAGGQVAEGGSLGLLGTQNVMDTPFSTTSYTRELTEDQQARTAADTLINDASVRLSTGSNGFDDTFQVRGFPVGGQDVGLNGLYGLVSSNRVQAQIIERIELLRGPGALVNGIAPGGSIGGGINIVTVRAGDQPLTRLTPTFISDGNFGTAVDIGRRYGQNNEWGIRFNGLYRDGETSIDDGNLRSGLAALGVDYRGERLRWSLDAIYQRDDTDNFRPQIAILPTVTSIPAPPDARSNWFPGTRLSQQDTTVATRLEYDITDSLTAYAAIGYRDGWNDQTFPNANPGANALGNFNVRNSYYDSYSETYSGTAGAKWRFNLLGVGHTFNFSYSGFRQEAGNVYITSAYTAASNIYNPSPLPIITAPRTDPQRASVTTLSSVAMADTLSFFNDRVLLTGGVRWQNVEVNSYNTTTGARTSRYDADATSPLVGLVVRPWENVSLYANYAEGLTRGTIVGPGYNNTGEILDPYKSQQYEAGVRVDWGKVMTTVSIFQITRPNAIRTASNDYAYDGEQRNRGIEVAAYGEIVPGLRAMASAMYLKPELTSPSTASERGNDAAGVPNWTFSGGLDWDVPRVPGLTLSGRLIYTGGAYMTTANTLRFDDWTRVDFGVQYRTEVARTPVVFRANLENAFGSDYWLTTGNYVTVGSPRTFIFSASIDF